MRIAIAAAVLLVTTSIAAAQAPGETMSWDPEPAPPGAAMERVTVSYRGQIIAADVASLGLAVLSPSIAPEAPTLSALGVTGFFVAAPLVHLAHGRGSAAAKSLALRVGLPFAGALVGYRLGPDDLSCVQSVGADGSAPHGDCGDHGSIIGLLLGAAAGGVTAVYVDVKYLSRYETTRPATWTAGIQPTRGGMSLSVRGAF